MQRYKLSLGFENAQNNILISCMALRLLIRLLLRFVKVARLSLLGNLLNRFIAISLSLTMKSLARRGDSIILWRVEISVKQHAGRFSGRVIL